MRGKQSPKRPLTPDSRYANPFVGKFISYIMKEGKKATAESIVYGAFDLIAKKDGKNPLDIFEEAIKNVMPQVEVRSKRVGGANYQVPMPVRGDRARALAYRWIIGAAHARKGRSMQIKLAEEITDAVNNAGEAIKKKQDVHRMAEANRAFAHFARF